MERLWAPWRIKYIREVIPIRRPEGCIFCDAARATEDREKLVIFRGTHAFVMLNLFPYNNGHLMVAPYRHVATLEELSDEEGLDLWRLTKCCLRLLRDSMSPDGFNVGVNIGRIAGAGVESHVHVHIVPRWCGDTNFMPVIGETKVIPEAIYDTYDFLLKFVPKAFQDYSQGQPLGARREVS